MSYSCHYSGLVRGGQSCSRRGFLHRNAHRGYVAVLLALLYAGCTGPHPVRSGYTGTASGATTVEYCLAMLNRFHNADSLTRALIYEQVSTQAVLDPTASNRLRLALLKAWPGHSGYNAEAAREMLKTALSQPTGLTPATENLARVHLQVVEQQLEAAGRNRALAAELEEARSKLEALTRIERTVETTPRAEAAQPQ